MSERSYSPKIVASALGVSESSLKRWCDVGRIEVTKTIGGHRRIQKSAVLDFIRSNRFDLAKPELVGLPPLSGSAEVSIEKARVELVSRLIDGDELGCRQILLQLHLNGHRISQIGDEVVSHAFREIGDRWECATLEVYQERLSCEICTRTLGELRGLVHRPDATAPLAIGATPEEDPYSLPTSLVEMVIAQNGYRAVNLGTRIPVDSIIKAIERMKPSLFWLSVSHLDDPEAFLKSYDQLYQSVKDQVAIVVGGRALTDALRARMQFAIYCDRLSHLDLFLQSFRPN